MGLKFYPNGDVMADSVPQSTNADEYGFPKDQPKPANWVKPYRSHRPQFWSDKTLAETKHTAAGIKRTKRRAAHLLARGQTPLTTKISKILILQMQGYTQKAIAKELGLSIHNVRQTIYDAKKTGMLDTNVGRLDNAIVPHAITKLGELVDEKHPEAIFQTLKGRGYFKQYQQVKQEGGNTMQALQVQVVMPEHLKGAAPPETIEGSVVGIPRDFTEDE